MSYLLILMKFERGNEWEPEAELYLFIFLF